MYYIQRERFVSQVEKMKKIQAKMPKKVSYTISRKMERGQKMECLAYYFYMYTVYNLDCNFRLRSHHIYLATHGEQRSRLTYGDKYRGVVRLFQRGGGVTLGQTISSWRFRHGIL